MIESPDLSTLVELLRNRASHQPDQCAYTLLVDGETEEVHLTYQQLDRQARAIGACLQSLGATGERALLLHPPGLEYITAFFGCLYAGVVPVPAYPPRLNRPTPRIQAIAANAEAAMALTTTSILSQLQRRFEQSPELKGLHCLGTSYLEPLDQANDWQEPQLTRDSLAFIQYTSGSTASPKGVMVTHSNLLHNLALIQEAFKITPEATGVSWMPLYHDSGLILAMLLAMYVGAPLIMMSPTAFVQRPVRWLQAITRYRGTISGAPNFAYQMCVDRISPEERASLDLSSWEVAICGGEPIRAETFEGFAETFAPCGFRPEVFYPLYGLAEATLMVSAKAGSVTPNIRSFERSALENGWLVETDRADEDGQRFVSCGQVSSGQRVAIVDPVSLVPCRPNQVGEIWVSGPSVAQGYWNQPEETQHTFQAHTGDTGDGPFLRTGDLGFVEDGELYVTGRLKEVIIIRGLNYYPQDIELSAQKSHPALQPDGAAAFSIPVAGQEQLVIVQEVKRRYRNANVAEIAKAIRRAVAEDQELAVYAVVLVKPGRVPRTSSGKIQRYACRVDFLAHHLQTIGVSYLEDTIVGKLNPLESAFARPRTPIEDTLVGIWSEVLALGYFGIHDNFFELGGDSLHLTQVVSRVREVFQVDLSLRSLFETPTVAGFAEQIEGAIQEASTHQLPPVGHVDRNGPLPLAFSQERMWFLHQLQPKSSAYNICGAIHLTGLLDKIALEATFDELVRRHEALRTTFATLDGQPIQVIAPTSSARISMVDLREFPKPEGRSQAIRLAREEARRPFDLSRGPLWRISLLQLDDDEYFLLFNLHHIIADAWSLGLLEQDMVVCYNAFASGESVRLPEPPIQFADFAVWQRQWLQGEVLEAQMAYWRSCLDGTPVLELPTDHPRPVMQGHRGATRSFDIDGRLMDELKRLSRREGVTLFITLLAAFKTMLYRYTGQMDIAIGVPIANRNWLAAEGVVGTLVNTLVMRTDLSGNPTFRQLLRRVRETALGAYAHQDLPFAKLVAELKPERDTSHEPLIQVMFDLINVQMPPLEIEGLTATPVEIDRQGAQFDLTLTVTDTPALRQVTVEYNTDLFEADTIERMVGHLQTLLERIAADPDQHLSALPLLTEAELDQLLVEWNDTRREYPRHMRTHELFEAQVERTPDAVAVVFEDRSLTYGELNASANRVACYLRRLGVGPGGLVGICMERSLEMLVGLLGILKAGGAYVPLDPAYPKERLDFMMADSQAAVLLTQEGLVGRLSEHGAEVVCVDGDWPEIARQSERNSVSGVRGTDLAYVIYTSGSTGRPKGVQIPHQAVVNFLSSMRERPGLGSGDVLLAVTTLSFDIALLELFLPLSVGARVVIVSREIASDGRQLAQALCECGATVMQATPATWRLLLEAGWQGSGQLKMLCGGEALPRELAEELVTRGAWLWNMYGPTETTVWSSVERIKAGDEVISIGRPIANTEMYILDCHLQPVPIGMPGELYIGGDCLARGYFNRPELTAEKFIEHPFRDEEGARLYYTGDLARYLPDGNIEFLGRRDYQVKVRGFRIELGEIEASLLQHSTVREAVVIAAVDDDDDKSLVAYLVIEEDAAPSVTELRSFLKDKLPDYMIPSAYVLLDALPLTPNGKVDRRALPEPDQEHLKQGTTFVAPRDTVERQLARVWEEVLDIHPVGVRDSFFDLGGHSLLGVRLFAQIEEVLGKQLPVATLFQSPTVEQMAEVIREDGVSPNGTVLVPIQSEGSKPPFFCVHGFGGGVLGYAELARLLGKEQPFYGLQARGSDGQEEPHTAIDEMAAYYIEAIRTIQPRGPYYLGGYCYGGIVAFEMARQLQAKGEQLGLVAILEGNAPSGSEALGKLWRPHFLIGFLPNLPYWLRDNMRRRGAYNRIWARLRLEARAVLPWAIRDWDIPTAQIGVESIIGDASNIPEEQRKLMEKHLQAVWNYRPQVYQGRVTLFRTRTLSLSRSHDPEMGWGELATGGVEIKMIPGAHYNILEKPYVEVLAAQLKSSLAQVNTVGQGRPGAELHG